MDNKKIVSMQVEESLLNDFDEFCKNVGSTRTGLVTMFMKYCATNRELPFKVGDKVNAPKTYKEMMDEPTYSILRESILSELKK